MKINVLKPVVKAFDPETYVLDEELKNAVEVAIALNQPILLTGEPGTGKTRLADKVAHELAKDPSQARFHNKPLAFFTKTTSAARDLFYTYDALGHFQAANIKREEAHKAPKTADFIDLQALGLAIAKSNPANLDRSKFKTLVGEESSSSVVLIDEPGPVTTLGNTLLIATVQPMALESFAQHAAALPASLPAEFRTFAQSAVAAARVATAVDLPPFTDDNAPVERIVHQIIFDFLTASE